MGEICKLAKGLSIKRKKRIQIKLTGNCVEKKRMLGKRKKLTNFHLVVTRNEVQGV